MKTASVQEISAEFGDYLRAAKREPVVVTQRGKPVAVLLRADDRDDLERLLMGHSAPLQRILEAARKRFRQGAGIPHGQFWREVAVEHAGDNKRRNASRKNGRKFKGQ